MRIGKVPDEGKATRLDITIECSRCGRALPGGILADRDYAKTDEFREEIARLQRTHMCGACRDAVRVGR